ncbi:DUF4422 domain-containing protein [Pedobacter frigiditerrae]|uniref:DUF4422 domain-containing protein n=1 Tax=Pedobacter frigiditerrae TaxID=2530452 RepID=A0A4R0N2G2_9SPHI|nr:DUF4422 domain-containing protein [Pedobacter frigiditerrae]TCC93537.1 DUF4422 domain-containing protein [Pedobacter frigiditerrae]
MYDKDLTIFSVFHKEYPVPNCSFIKPIQVGKDKSQIDLGFLSDSDGENISDRNSRFCETTALYWIWKNLDKIDSQYIGLSHYRRYFSLPEVEIKQNFWRQKKNQVNSDAYIKSLSDANLDAISSPMIKNHLLEKLNKKQIVLAKASSVGCLGVYPLNIKDQFIYYHLREDWALFEEALEKLAPTYFEFAKTFFSSGNTMHCYHMFTADKQFIEAYCSWLFPILFELEKTIKVSPYAYQNRTIGFLSERLLNLYIYKKQLSISEMPIVYFT